MKNATSRALLNFMKSTHGKNVNFQETFHRIHAILAKKNLENFKSTLVHKLGKLDYDFLVTFHQNGTVC